MLRVENLTAAVGGTPILKGLDLAVDDGEVHAVMGPNGSGKSTLAHALAGREGYELGGAVTFDGEDLLAMDPESIPDSMPAARAAVETVAEILGELGLAVPGAAVAFALSLDPDRVIVAANSAVQLEELTAAAGLSLPASLSDSLADRLGVLPAEVIDPRTWSG